MTLFIYLIGYNKAISAVQKSNDTWVGLVNSVGQVVSRSDACSLRCAVGEGLGFKAGAESLDL